MTRRQEHAFTLIELLVVLAIIAALLTLVVPRY
ncbi:prepilin-type N-terminal cleavage/methylation domain-containing protein, partial [Salmonella enterica subsp. enterica serovar Soahanina]